MNRHVHEKKLQPGLLQINYMLTLPLHNFNFTAVNSALREYAAEQGKKISK